MFVYKNLLLSYMIAYPFVLSTEIIAKERINMPSIGSVSVDTLAAEACRPSSLQCAVRRKRGRRF
jgi:hypothetical protein